MTVYNFGSINIDHVYRVPHFVRPGETLSSRSLETLLGGKGANQSIALARAGTEVVHLGRIGGSDDWAVRGLADAGVDVSRIERVDGASGHALIQVDDSGENCIVLHGGANRDFDPARVATLLEGAGPDDWLLLQNECNALAEIMQAADERGLAIAFNPAPMSPEVASLPLARCRLLVLNEIEACELAGEKTADRAATSLAERHPDTTLVLTLGAEGARHIAGGETLHVETPRVEAIDTTGAGDTFVGYFLASVARGDTPREALDRACAAAALSVTRPGAAAAIPDADAVERFRRERA